MKRILACLGLAVIALYPLSVFAQDAGLTGKVTDSDGKPIPGAVITVKHVASGIGVSAGSDAQAGDTQA